MLKIILKLWPALSPIVIYFLWVLLERLILKKIFSKKNEKDGEKIIGESSTEIKEVGTFSLQNRRFVFVLYISLIGAIGMLINLGLS